MNFITVNIRNRTAAARVRARTRLLTAVFTLPMVFLAPAIAAQTFAGLSDAIAQGSYGNLNAVVISQHGEIIYEDYFRGAHAGQLQQVQSVTKSIGSTLIGIAHRQGKIRLDQQMGDFFSGLYDMSLPAYQGKANISVEQILQQRHGVAWDEDSLDYRDPQNPVRQMIESDDWYSYFLTRPMDAAPGEKFSYSSGASTLMSRLLRVSTGMGPDEFAMQALFAPLGINNTHWEIYNEAGMGFGITDWPNPDQDISLGFSLWLTARDLVKIGELYLNGGSYNGQQILDKSWIDASWTKYSHSGNSAFFPEPGWGHGYQWWIAALEDTLGRSWNIYFASGWGSQVIFILPELDVVVVTTADNHDYNGPNVDAMLLSRILPELKPGLDSRFSGSWYDPDTNGQGFSMQVLDERNIIVGYWYTYTDSGNKRWFTLQGEIVDGTGEVKIYETSGGVFLKNDPVSLNEWGTGLFRPKDCDHMDVEIDSEEVSITIPMKRLTGNCFTPP